MMKGVLAFALVLFSLGVVSGALGVSPPKQVYDFEPGGIYEMNFRVLSDQPDTTYKLEVAGNDLKDLIIVDKQEIIGQGGFKAILRLPNSLPKPGENSAIIWIREQVGEEAGIATTLNAGAVIIIRVPYPGKYAEVGFSIGDANSGDIIPYYVDLVSRGEESVNINSEVRFYSSDDELKDSNKFTPVTLASGEKRIFEGKLDTSDYIPGNYYAQAIVEYDGKTEIINKTFRVGSLFVNITNYTRELERGGIKKFEVEVESKFNIDIKDIFASVEISDGNNVISSFQTPSKKLIRWEKETLEGFFETDELEGTYLTHMAIHYDGETTVAEGTLDIIDPVNMTKIVLLIGTIVFLIIILGITLLLWRHYRKDKNKKKKKNIK